MKKNSFASIEKIISIAKNGGMFILVDDEKRENEGDLIISTSDSNAKNINFMAKFGRGLICLALDSIQSKRLNLSLMSPVNESRNKTAFTISIEARNGITTGISAKDRAKTIKIASKKNVNKNEIVSPGHVFPIIAKDGGVLVRAGHTEASVDISKLANMNPSSVICEVMNEDGRMARLDDLLKFAKKHKLKIASIEDLISYRLKNEKLVSKIKNKKIKIEKLGLFDLSIFKNKLDNLNHLAITRGKISLNKPSRVRVISIKKFNKLENLKNKVFIKSIKYLSQFNNFVLIVIKNEMSETNKDETIKSTNILRYYGIGAQIIKDLKIKNMILVSRAKKKIIGLDGYGIRITKQEIIK